MMATIVDDEDDEDEDEDDDDDDDDDDKWSNVLMQNDKWWYMSQYGAHQL